MSTSPTFALVALALAFGTAATAHADSFTSSASSAASQSVGSVSDSLSTSSKSSTPGKTAAAGDYEVTRVAALPDRADTAHRGARVRLHLAPTADTARANAGTAPFTLDLPRAALGEQGMAVGDVVRVAERAYGYEFARAATQQAFFLALTDAWMRELDARAL